MTYRLRTMSRAHRDVTAILTWIARERRSKTGAASWLRAYETAARKLTHSPESYGLAPEDDGGEQPVRQFLFKTRQGNVYRGLFIIEANEVVILRVRGSGQPPLEPDELA